MLILCLSLLWSLPVLALCYPPRGHMVLRPSQPSPGSCGLGEKDPFVVCGYFIHSPLVLWLFFFFFPFIQISLAKTSFRTPY